MLTIFKRRRQKISHRGGVDAITPGLISGWVYAPTVPLTDVRLLQGPHLLAQAVIDQPRPDVAELLGVPGNFGFQLLVSGELPAAMGDQVPQILASSADGRVRVELQHLPARAQTAQRLQQALAAEVRGAMGHFDGLSPDGQALQGWGYRRGPTGQEPLQVWLQLQGQPALAVRCDQYRPGMAAQGHPEGCGFRVPLAGLPFSWAGQAVRLSFDAAGQIPLPGAASCSIPGLTPAGTVLKHPVSGSPYAARLSETPKELQQSWQAVEQFRQFLDGLEAQISRAEALQDSKRNQALQAAQRPQRKRDQLRRLLGGGS
ncbi:MAG: hypothetical protein WAM11_08540 [Cyanobium sp.]